MCSRTEEHRDETPDVQKAMASLKWRRTQGDSESSAAVLTNQGVIVPSFSRAISFANALHALDPLLAQLS